MIEPLTEEKVISVGGWHPRYARVVLIQQVGDQAIVLVDGNGDGSEVELEHWYVTDEGWTGGHSSGVGSLDDRPLWASGWTSGVGYVVGTAPPQETVVVEWRGEIAQASANELGVWVCLFPGQPPPLPPRAFDQAGTGIGIGKMSPGELAAAEADRPRIVRPG